MPGAHVLPTRSLVTKASVTMVTDATNGMSERSSFNSTRVQQLTAVAIILVLLLLLDRRPGRPQAATPPPASPPYPADYEERLRPLYPTYLHVGESRARAMAKEMIAIHLDVPAGASGRSWGLFLAWARLYAVEAVNGNDGAAADALAEVRRYRGRKGSSAATPSDDELGEELLDLIERWERNQNDGKLPKWWPEEPLSTTQPLP